MLIAPFVAINATVKRESQNEYLAETADFLKQHITCFIDNSKVSIASDGRVISDGGSKDFIISEGESFHNQPDHHSSLSYKLKKISSDKITIEYYSSFDHRSFGKDLLTTDTGIVELKCNEKP